MNAHAYWKCFQFLDPRLRDGRVDQEKYTTSLDEFRQYYGSVEVISIILDLHLDVEVKKGPSDFAYVLVVWKDSKKVAHLFRERWVKDEGRWYTRVAGLVAPEPDEEEERTKEKTHAKRQAK
jgi:hypothetical protein